MRLLFVLLGALLLCSCGAPSKQLRENCVAERRHYIAAMQPEADVVMEQQAIDRLRAIRDRNRLGRCGNLGLEDASPSDRYAVLTEER